MLSKRVFGLFLLAVAAVNCACSPPPSDSIRFGLASSPANLDPRYATDAASARINRLMYRRLVDFDAEQKAVPSLATWEQLNPLQYRFRLGKDGRRFHDGTYLTAEDVRATYRSILNDEPVSPHRSTLALIQDIKIIDADTLDFHLSHPDPLFPAYMVIGIVPGRLLNENHKFQNHPVGSGEFRFEDWPEPERLRLVRGSDQQVFEFLRVSDPTVRVLKLLRGEIDILQNDIPTELINYLASREEVRIERKAGSNFTYLGFNLEDSVTGLLPVRQAIAHAIERDLLIQYVLGGAARPAGALLPPEHWAGHPSLTGYPYDPVKARSLLDGIRPRISLPLKLTYKTSSDPVRIRIATILQQQLNDIGIELEIQSYDWGTFYGDIKKGHFQLYGLSWVGIKTPDIFHYIFHSTSIPPAGANRGRFRDPKVDEMLANIKETGQLERQVMLYHQLQERLFDQLPYIPLWHEDHIFAASKQINGYTLATDGNYDGLLQVYRQDHADPGH